MKNNATSSKQVQTTRPFLYPEDVPAHIRIMQTEFLAWSWDEVWKAMNHKKSTYRWKEWVLKHRTKVKPGLLTMIRVNNFSNDPNVPPIVETIVPLPIAWTGVALASVGFWSAVVAIIL